MWGTLCLEPLYQEERKTWCSEAEEKTEFQRNLEHGDLVYPVGASKLCLTRLFLLFSHAHSKGQFL